MSTVTNMKVPKHIAIIMDGNGRWANKRNKSRNSGHYAGGLALKRAILFAVKYNINYLSVYAFSKENWKRPESEVSSLMSLFVKVLKGQKKFLIENNIRLNPIGDLKGFSPLVYNKLEDLVKITSKNTGLTLNVCLNYSGQWDITQACCSLYTDSLHNILKQIKSLSTLTIDSIEDIFNKEFIKYASVDNITPLLGEKVLLADQDPIDLIIRTSNEHRISNFFLWQAAYSEFIFIKEYWPDFNHELFIEAIKEFNSRERRFGGLEGK